jgi:hypothetical protein
MKALDHIPGVVSFLAVVMGISPAPKWDSAQQGLRHLTLFGWVTVGLGAAALLASLLLTRHRQKEADIGARQHKHLQDIAHAEVRLALRQITWPFFALFGDETEASEFQLVPPHIEDAERLASVMRIQVRSKDRGLSGSTFDEPWADVLKGNADQGAARIDRALQIYATYLDPPVLEALSELRTSEFLVLRLQRLDEDVKMNTHVAFLEFPFPSPPSTPHHGMDFGFGQFWDMIRRLDELLLRDPARLRRRL